MLHTGIGVKVISLIGKILIYPLIVWAFYPTYDLLVPIVVQDYALLNPYVKELLNDIKIILGVLIAIFALVKLIYGVVKIKKEVDK